MISLIFTPKKLVQRYFIQLAYKGTHYHGWQRQPNAISVQQKLEEALSTVLRRDIQVTGAGRTDTGVHASRFFAHFDAVPPLEDTEHARFKANNYLPWDIAIQRIFEVVPRAHARYDAIAREYQYQITQEKDPFRREFAVFYPQALDFERMNEAAALLKQYTDFTSFAVAHGNAKTNLCTISHAVWTQQDSLHIFTIRANRFLRKMVRSIVGTLFEAGRGKLTPEEFRQIIESRNRTKAGKSVAPHGLFLTGIVYPDSIYPVHKAL